LIVVNAWKKDIEDFRNSMPLIERMTNSAMKVSPDKKRVKYWEIVF
jgi:hypothetical protein